MAWPLLLLGMDVGSRARTLLDFTFAEGTYYGASMVLSVAFYGGVVWCLRRLRQRAAPWQYVSVLCLTGVFYVFVLFTAYSVFFANGDLPDLFLLSFIRCETANAIILAKDSFHWYDFILLSIGTGLLCCLLHALSRQAALVRKFTLREKTLAAAISYAALWYCWSGTSSHGQCFMPIVRSPAILAMYAYNECKGINPLPIEMRPRTPRSITRDIPRPAVNVLLILNESLRRQNLQLYGYARPTTPCLSRFAGENPGNFFQFERCYANSTSTLLSVPSILTGISPLQPLQYRCEEPLLWQWAAAADMRSFYISSHDLAWCKMRPFFTTPGPDDFWDKQTSGQPAYRDMGIDDHFTVERAVRQLRMLEKSPRPFLGVIHLNTNHYPYNTRKSYQLWQGADVDLYDNTVVETDAHAGRILDTLKATGQLGNTVVIFTSDHGEAFNEHGYIAHFYCHFAETISVPLWIYLPPPLLEKIDPSALKNNLSAAVQNLDLLPTMLDCIGAWPPGGTPAAPPRLLGESLLRPIGRDRTLWITNADEVMNSTIGLSSITGFRHYLLRTSSTPAKEDLYDLAVDATEKNNLWDRCPEAQRDVYRQGFLQFPVAAKTIQAAFRGLFSTGGFQPSPLGEP